MKMKTTTIKEANRADLMYIANTVLNIPVAKNIGVEKLRATLADVHDSDLQIEVPDASDPVAEARVKAAADRKTKTDVQADGSGFAMIAGRRVALDSNGHVPIEATPTELDKDMPNIQVGVNGVNMLVPYGEYAPVPPAYFEALMNASYRVPVKNRDNKIIGWNMRQRHNISVVPPRD